MTARKTPNRPPFLHIQRLKNKVVEQLHNHDNVVNHFAEKILASEKGKNKVKQQNRYVIPASQSLEESIIMLDSPSIDEMEDRKKSIQVLGSGLKIMKVQCSWNTDGKNEDHGFRDERQNKSLNQQSFQSKQKNNPETRYERQKSNAQLKQVPRLKKLKAISFKRQTIDTDSLTEMDGIKESQSKIIDDSKTDSLNKNESQRRIILSEASQSPLIGNREASSIFSAFLPINSNIKQDHGSEKNLPFNHSGPENNQNNTTPDSKFKKRTAPATQEFATQRKQAHQKRNADSKTLYINRTNKTQQAINTVPKKFQDRSESKMENDSLFKIFEVLLTPEKPNEKNEKSEKSEKEKLKSSKSDFNLGKQTTEMVKSYALGDHKQSEEFKRLRNAMTNQKNLKLKDYLRLASLSNDSKFDRLNNLTKPKEDKNLLNLKQSETTNMRKSFIVDKNRTAIDSEKSISLIKASLKRKLEKSISLALKLTQQIGEDKQLLGQSYDDLVFICNYNKIFDENMFKTVDLLEDLLNSYKNKRLMGELMEDDMKIAQLKSKEKKEIKELFSPLKKGKKRPVQNLQMNLIQKLLRGFHIIPEISKGEIRQT